MGELSISEVNKLRVESHFGFRDIPFGVAPDPRFFYENPLYAEGLAALIHGLENKKGFMLVTGEVGTGKTILLRKLMRQLEPSTRYVFVSTSHLTAYGLIEFMLQSLIAAQGKNSIGVDSGTAQLFARQGAERPDGGAAYR